MVEQHRVDSFSHRPAEFWCCGIKSWRGLLCQQLPALDHGDSSGIRSLWVTLPGEGLVDGLLQPRLVHAVAPCGFRNSLVPLRPRARLIRCRLVFLCVRIGVDTEDASTVAGVRGSSGDDSKELGSNRLSILVDAEGHGT